MIKRGNCTDFAPLLVLDYKTGVGTRTCLKFFPWKLFGELMQLLTIVLDEICVLIVRCVC